MPGTKVMHIGAIRVRVVGSGNLRPSLLGFDFVLRQTLLPLAMADVNSREMTRLCNFISQENMLKLETTVKDEVMRVNRVTLFAKPIWTDYPA